MKLRDHPLMTRRSGVKNWPPHLTALSEQKNDWPIGEIGTLKRVWKHGEMNRCLFLFVEHSGKEYTGMMYFDDPAFCRAISSVLTSNTGMSMKDIGNLDLSHTL